MTKKIFFPKSPLRRCAHFPLVEGWFGCLVEEWFGWLAGHPGASRAREAPTHPQTELSRQGRLQTIARRPAIAPR